MYLLERVERKMRKSSTYTKNVAYKLSAVGYDRDMYVYIERKFFAERESFGENILERVFSFKRNRNLLWLYAKCLQSSLNLFQNIRTFFLSKYVYKHIQIHVYT